MATGHKTYYLVKGSQFWEIRVKGRDTVIRGGKVGCKGRQFPTKEHPTPAKALQFALRQVNAKIILGFESIEEDCNKSLVVKTPVNQNVKKLQGSPGLASKTIPTLRPKQPPKKRDTIRRLVQQKTLRCQLQDHLQPTNGSTPVVNKSGVAPWRKPPKKQSTIRRLVRRESTIRQAKTNEKITPVKRKLSLSQKSATIKPKNILKRQSVSQSETTPVTTSRILTRQASRLSQPDIEVKPRMLGTLTFIEKSSTLPVDVEILKNNDPPSIAPKCEKVEKTVLTKRETVMVSATVPNGEKSEAMPVLTKEDTIKVNLNKPVLSSAPSLTLGIGAVYIPAASSWPMQLSAPVLWSENTVSEVCANAVYVDNTICIYGDDTGKVVLLDSRAQIEKTYQLHTKIRTIQKQDGYLYVGCSDGIVYEISNVPYQMYRPPASSFREVQGIVLYGNVLVTSNVKGQLCAVDHDGKVLWQKKSMGDGGWMLCADDSGVYHGHSGGVTKYVLQDGNQIWYRRWTASIFGVVQNDTYLYVADNVRIKKLRKDTGVHEKTYAHKGSGCIMSVAMGGGLLFAAGSACITCYEETSAQVVYRLLQGGQPLGLQYHLGRLYCVGSGGLFVIDLSEEGIKKHKGDKHPQYTLPSSSRFSSSIRSPMKVPSISSPTKQGVILHCIKDKDVVPKVKPESESFNCDLSVEFPVNIRRVGARYTVTDLKASNTGQFYRIQGDIFELE